ncbi:ABC transporter permease [Spiroplasma corruscae]|uniref:Transport permease protein n=1 Tax=Spiroplasma corruscae TaxID=216934 RepID=A0A222EQ32_9MOLU|nr:ABC transporter permease [Spiroplasma corruscae]ASP28649.1 ABC transporter permease [Spiroplasma corruscae]
MIAIFRLEFFKFIKNPWTIFFGIFFPIMWILIDGFVWGKYSIGESNIKVINFVFPGLIILVATTFTISTISITLCRDRLEKRLKQISITNISIFKYMIGLGLWNYIVFICDFLLMFIIAYFGFGLSLSFINFLFLIIVPLVIFIINFFIAICLANISKTSSTNTFITIFVFYIMIFLSGASIPTYLFPDWYKWIQIFIPTGSGVLLLTYLSNGISTNEIWYTYIITLIYLLVFLFLSIKLFKWQ